MDYSIFPPINASLNTLSTILLITGFILIKSGRKEAHRKVMMGALASSTIFLICYLIYHYGAGHTEFPKEYPLARRIYLGILIPHILLAVVNVPLIILLVLAAMKGNFERHKKLARITLPSWLFVSVTGVVIYFFIYVWFLPQAEADEVSAVLKSDERITIIEAQSRSEGLIFKPASQAVRTEAGRSSVEVKFEVENQKKEAAKIARLDSGCECLSVEIDQDPVPAGGKAVITGIFDIGRLRGESERKIAVQFEGQSSPVFLTARIETDPVYSISEEMTSWEIGSSPETKTVKFRVVREKPVRVLSAESKRREVSCELVVVEEGRSYDLKLTPESTSESLLGIVRMETDCEIESYARPLAYFSIQ
ncbi:MAG: DUF420 domain-containing protein [Verrucomicrobiales bacterium]|nr:DUF420 domain-containing protein [Verrucomicrobiales bacterium]